MWEVVVLVNQRYHRYSYWGKNKYPDQLSAYMAAQKELDQEEQTNGNHC